MRRFQAAKLMLHLTLDDLHTERRMRTVPKDRAGILSFYQVHAGVWFQRAAELQIDPQHAEEVQALTLQAREALEQQQLALILARAATGRYNSLLRKLSKQGGALLSRIQARGMLDEGVYALAMIPRRRKKSPIPPPGQPYGHTAELCKTGALILKWKCRNPARAEGTLYNIYRQLGHDGPMVYLASVGQREFIDDNIPPGTPIVHYQIRASRTTGEGECATFEVKFGGGMPKEGRFIPRKRRKAA
jgi:hypothetical protein